MSRATVRGRSGRPGSAVRPPASVNRNARVPAGPLDQPTTSPCALMAQATLLVSPDSAPRSSTAKAVWASAGPTMTMPRPTRRAADRRRTNADLDRSCGMGGPLSTDGALAVTQERYRTPRADTRGHTAAAEGTFVAEATRL